MAEYHLAGAYEIQVAKANSSGYPVGQVADPETIANGTEMHAYRCKSFVSATAPAVSSLEVTFTGGMKVRGKRNLGLSDFGSFTLTLGSFDDAFAALVLGSTIDTSSMGTAQRLFAPNHNLASKQKFWLLMTAGAQNADTGADGFMHFAYYGQFKLNHAEISSGVGVNPMPMVYDFVPTQTNRLINGKLFSASSLAVEDNADWVHSWHSLYRVGLSSYKDDASDTSITVGYRPVTSDNDNSYNVFTKNGADNAANVSGFSTSTGVATVTAGTAADMWVIVYTTRFQAI